MDEATRQEFDRSLRLLREGKYEESIQTFRQVLQDDPQTAQVHYVHTNIGSALLLQKKYRQSVPEFQEALRINPDDTMAAHGLGYALLRLKRLDESIAASRQGLQRIENLHLAPSDKTYHNLGLASLMIGDLGAAQEACRMAIRLDPEFALTHMHLGHVYLKQENYDWAVREYREALRLNPRLWNAKRGLVISLILNGHLLGEMGRWLKRQR